MKHTPLDQLAHVAAIHTEPAVPLTRPERLARWAKLLDLHEKPVTTLDGTEYQSDESRAGMKRSGSALAVAFADPVLRTAGLDGETYGQAKSFFALSNHQLHYIICGCHNGSHMNASDAARRVRAVGAQPDAAKFFYRVRRLLGWR
jgi:hypothetical protein